MLFQLLGHIFCFFVPLNLLLHETFQVLLELFGQNPQGFLELLNLILFGQHVGQDVVLEAACLAETTTEVHDTDAILYASIPCASVLTPVLPGHFTVA